MAEFLTTAKTTACIEEVINEAKERVVLLSPYLKASKMLQERLKDANRRGVRIAFVHGKVQMGDPQRRQLEKLGKLSLYFCENLHAKCYFNERQLVIASMNLHEFSERNNYEMGLRILATDPAYGEAVAEAHRIIQAARLIHGSPFSLPALATLPAPASRKRTSVRGYCIRCGDSIPRDPKYPLCPDCFDVWEEFKNWDYTESHCHSCGADAETSRRKPLCPSCWAASTSSM